MNHCGSYDDPKVCYYCRRIIATAPKDCDSPALAIEARRAATLGAVHESAGPKDNAQQGAA